jgi:hypothetical protein
MSENKRRDLFISHATEDKEIIARPLAQALLEEGFSVWFDEYELKLGDSIRESIDKGLSQSAYGIVILSQSFFIRHWTTKELNALSALESDGKTVILPIWHGIDKNYVLERSPMLADRYAARSEDGLDSVVRMICKRIRGNSSVRNEIEVALSSLTDQSPEAIKKQVASQDFNVLKHLFINVLSGIGFYDLELGPSNKPVFDFIKIAILERASTEASELFGCLLDWYLETPTPNSNVTFLHTFAELVKLPFARETIKKKGLQGLFIAEFGKSHSWVFASITTKILVNLQSLFSPENWNQIVDHMITNDQIQSSFDARGYLDKLLVICEGKVNPEKIREARKKIFG